MSKMDITISRDATLNTGNYSSIKPSVTLTLKDVDADVVSEKYEKLSRVLDVFMMLETLALGSEMESAQTMGYKKYITELEKVDNPLDDAINILKGL